MVRDKLREEEYFKNTYQEYIMYLEKYVSNHVRLVAERGEDGDGVNACHICICSDTLRQFYSGYSLGLGKSELMTDEMFKNYYHSIKMSWKADSYIDMFEFLCICIIYDKKLEEIKDVLELLKKYDYKDIILDSMAQYYIPTWEINYEKLKFKRDYSRVASIIKAAETDKTLATEKLKDYLDKRWLKLQTGGIVANTQHLSKDQYMGYWCLEAPALVKMFGLDDSSLKECQHYPYDLLH